MFLTTMETIGLRGISIMVPKLKENTLLKNLITLTFLVEY